MIENQATISLLLKELINGKRELEINLFHFHCVLPVLIYILCSVCYAYFIGKGQGIASTGLN